MLSPAQTECQRLRGFRNEGRELIRLNGPSRAVLFDKAGRLL